MSTCVRLRWLDDDRALRDCVLDVGQRQWRLQCRLKYEREPSERVQRDARLLRLAALQVRQTDRQTDMAEHVLCASRLTMFDCLFLCLFRVHVRRDVYPRPLPTS